jgi:hypothetical protein
MTYLILGMGTGEIIVLLIIIVISMLTYKYGKKVGENKAYKTMLNNNSTTKSAEIIRLEKLLADKLITQEEFDTLKEKIN